MKALTPEEIKDTNKYCQLNYVSTLSKGLVQSNPKDVALHGLTAMIKVIVIPWLVSPSPTFTGERVKL